MARRSRREGDSRPVRVFLAKTSMDGHWIGVAVVGKALRDAGMEVIYGGVLDAQQILSSSLQEDADVIGLNIGGSYKVVEDLLHLLQSDQESRPIVVGGGTVPPSDVVMLKKKGIDEVFPPGSRLDSIIDYIRTRVEGSALGP